MGRLHLAGRVLLDDGMPPAFPFAVELICEGLTKVRTETDQAGRFGLEFDSPVAVHPDCSLRASLAGYRSASIPVAEMAAAPNQVTIALYRTGKYQGESISVTWLAAPESAKSAFHAGVRKLRRGSKANFTEAVRLFEAAVTEYPRYASAWFELGRVRLASGDASGAREAFRGAVSADPWFVSPYEPLLLMELGRQDWREVRRLSEQMLAMNPYLSEARYYRGIASVSLGELEAARQAATAIERGPEAETFALKHHLRGSIHESEGNFQAAVAEYRKYLSAEPEGSLAVELRVRLEKWEAETAKDPAAPQ